MEQLGGRGEGNDRNQQRRLKMPENMAAVQPPPQKCPRCDSSNTKFCYYNNYSLTQPRYFCKTCRRYWTQGGTLRNIPVGGGCRKGKRNMKPGGSSSSSAGESSSRTHQSLPPPLPSNVTPTLSAAFFSGGNSSRTQPLAPMSSLYGTGGGFLSTLAAMQSMAQPQAVNQSIGVSAGNQFGGNNMAFHLPTPQAHMTAAALTPVIEAQSGYYQMVNRGKTSESSFYPSDQTLFQPTRPLGSWTQRFLNTNNDNNPWNVSSASGSGATTNSATAASSPSPNQWPDLSGFSPSP